jgi:hypothetical protein
MGSMTQVKMKGLLFCSAPRCAAVVVLLMLRASTKLVGLPWPSFAHTFIS